MILRRFMKHATEQNWIAVGLDMIVVVVGIFLGMQMTDWNESRKERQQETVYLQEFREDFITNRETLAVAIERWGRISTAMIGLLEQSALAKPEWTAAELNDAFIYLHHMPVFTVTDRAFSNLNGSGELNLLRNRQFKNALAGYFSDVELVRLVQNTHELELVHTFQPYVIHSMDYQAVALARTDDYTLPPPVEEDRILDVLNSREFRNIVTQKWTIATDLLRQHRLLYLQTEEIISILEADLFGPEGAPKSQ